jgi:hypothetical protein
MSCTRDHERARSRGALRAAIVMVLALGVLTPGRAKAVWPPEAQRDGVYGRFGGNTDVSLKLGGMIQDSGLAGSVGGSLHYYSLFGVTGDYSESLLADAVHTRSVSFGMELRPLFLPRWALGFERGPAWLDLTLDSAALGFGAYFNDTEDDERGTRGVWLSLGFGAPLLGDASGPWLELRALRRFPDHAAVAPEAHNALFVYLSWHHVLQLGSSH